MRRLLPILVALLLTLAACSDGEGDAGSQESPSDITSVSTAALVASLIETPGADSAVSRTPVTEVPTTELPGPARTFAMGFTPFPYAITAEAVETVDAYLAREGDLVVMHFDNGIPWQAALDGAQYPGAFVADVDRAVKAADAARLRALQFTPINFLRDGLAPDAETQTLAPPWSARSFDDPAVIEAFLAHARWLIDRTRPDYVNYGIEANLLFEKAPQKWDAYLRFVSAVYPRLRAEYPDIGFFLSIQVDAIAPAPEAQRAAIARMLPYSDLVAVSLYPFVALGSLDAIPLDYFSAVAALAPDKPFAISETAWPAEDLGQPFPVTIPATPADQRDYLEWLLGQCERLGCVFLNWFAVRDYDDLFEAVFGPGDPLASIGRIWRDTGLYAGDGSERPALALWRQWFARAYRPGAR